jgi:protein-export membrane protein SecD
VIVPFRFASAVVISILVLGGAFYLSRPTQPTGGGPSPTPGLTANASPSSSPGAVACLRGEYRALPFNGRPVSSDGLAIIRTIIENRLRAFGVAQPDVQTQGTDSIVVQVPASANQDEVRALIGSTGRLDFVGVPPARSGEVIPGQPIPADLRVILSGDQVVTVVAGFTQTGQNAVDLTFREEGAQIFDEYAAAHFGEQFAIVLDGVVVSAPMIQATHFGGKAQISGSFSSEAEMNQFVTVLRYGALPNALEEVSFQPCPGT